MEYVVQAINVLRNLVHAETNAKLDFPQFIDVNYGPSGINMENCIKIYGKI
jgi:hypothetical protein